MGLDQANLFVQQRIRQGKVMLARLTVNKRHEAEIIGVSHTTLGRWCDVSDLTQNMPWQLLPLHSAADELLGALAEERGKTLVNLVDMGELNGDLTDERDKILVLLGKETEKLQKAMQDRRTPGRIDISEAYELLPIVTQMVRVAATAEAELHAILNGDR